MLTEDTGCLQNPADVRFLPGALATVAQLNRLGCPVVLVTSQFGIGRGYFDWPAYECVSERIRTEFAAAGADLRGALHLATGCGAVTRPEVLELLRTKAARTVIRFGNSLADLLPLLTPEASPDTAPTGTAPT